MLGTMIDPIDKGRASGGAKIMKDSKFAEVVKKFGWGIVFLGDGKRIPIRGNPIMAGEDG